MSDSEWTRVAALYIPMVLAILAGLLNTRRQRQFAACLLAVLWTLPSLLVLQRLNERAGWWSYAGGGTLFRGMPLELLAGWVVLWGIVPQLAFPRIAIGWSAAVMIAADLIGMPMCSAVVSLGPRWLVGEAAAVTLVLLPALCIARWTFEDTHLYLRAGMQVVISAMLFFFLVPEIVFAIRPGDGWGPLLKMGQWRTQLEVQCILLLAIPGVGAVMEFAERGRGTPIPYDPPKRLVTSGIYRYLANPMQLSCGLAMLVWALVLRNGWMVLAASLSVVYSAGIAEWDEGEDLARRFGSEWRLYRGAVKNWIPRWKPYHAGAPARLYIAASCGPCSELRAWLETRQPIGLEMIDAEVLPQGSINRIRYEAADGSGEVDGVRAVGRALEHLNLGWAFSGTALRLPIVWQAVQVLLDASGLGPRIPGAISCDERRSVGR